ncbi:hypothetical protein AAG570_007280 [Ranatra chinensis]|uniref:ornithine decarboxylase n=1 Tax=Ranatra chinensis TaxID=642074 RepID=A0ABD0YDY3_9HEMI
MDVGDVIDKFNNWKAKLPKIQPFYAVKCNDSPILLELMASLGCSFDCASKAEIAKVIKIGVSPERIVFANPVKMSSHLKFADRYGVDLMTFDSVCELYKIKAHHSNPKLVLRIRADSTEAQVSLGMKFGCEPEEAGQLLKTSASLGLPVVGVSFHVGSGCSETDAYARAIRAAARVAQLAKSYGHVIRLLDIGGGFPGDTGSSIKEIAEVVNATIAEEWSDWDDQLEVIAEPGRYFVSSAYTLSAAVHSVRNCDAAKVMYYINDGVYGSFNCILFDHAVKTPELLKVDGDAPLERCIVWGPTCDSTDMITDCALLPRLSVGDWLVFRDMGAYTIPVSTSFNGFPLPKVHHLISRRHW